ncbi:SH3 domain-containing protein [Geminocystis sp. CENA526]|uniref:SH3 domain-containing protein n=1 Tax=Geminocystis sp. CENA526 TaxID=1355871 RepID=UPI003D6FC3B2
MSLSSFFQFIVGFFLGIILFGAGIAGGAYFFLTNVAVNPSKHLFAEEKSTPEKKETPTPAVVEKKEEPPKVEEVKKEEPPAEKLPDGAYKARVTWSTGLSLRSEPSASAERVGGVGFNTEIIILTTSNDRQWQKVRIPNSQQEGWVKAGNVEKINE